MATNSKSTVKKTPVRKSKKTSPHMRAVIHEMKAVSKDGGVRIVAPELPGEIPIDDDLISRLNHFKEDAIKRIAEQSSRICVAAESETTLKTAAPALEDWLRRSIVGPLQGGGLSPSMKEDCLVDFFLAFADSLPAVPFSMNFLLIYGQEVDWVNEKGREQALVVENENVPKDLRVQWGGKCYTSFHPERTSIIDALRRVSRAVAKTANRRRVERRQEHLEAMSRGVNGNIVDMVERHRHFSFDLAEAHNNRGKDYPGVFLKFELLPGGRVRLVDYYVDAQHDNPRIKELVEEGVTIPVGTVSAESWIDFHSYDDESKRQKLRLLLRLARKAWQFVHKGGNPKRAAGIQQK